MLNIYIASSQWEQGEGSRGTSSDLRNFALEWRENAPLVTSSSTRHHSAAFPKTSPQKSQTPHVFFLEVYLLKVIQSCFKNSFTNSFTILLIAIQSNTWLRICPSSRFVQAHSFKSLHWSSANDPWKGTISPLMPQIYPSKFKNTQQSLIKTFSSPLARFFFMSSRLSSTKVSNGRVKCDRKSEGGI